MHIAIIASVSPPVNHVSTKRAYYFAHHLAQLGHKTTLLSADYRFLDSSILVEVDETKISHFIRIDPREWFPDFAKQQNTFALEPTPKNRLKSKALTFYRLLMGWGPWPNFGKRALTALLNLHKKEKIDITFAIFGDETSHEVAYRFHKKTNTPWIADFKDTWNNSVRGLAESARRFHTQKRIKTCLAVTETSEIQATVDQSEFNRQCFVIPSGFDLDLMNNSPIKEIRTPDKVSVNYFGSMSELHDWRKLIHLIELIDQSDIKGRVEFNWFGHIPSRLIDELIRIKLAVYINNQKQIPPSEVFSLMKGSQLLFLIPVYNTRGLGGPVGVKELEYVAAAQPILCLGKIHSQIKSVIEPELLHEFQDPEGAFIFLKSFLENPERYKITFRENSLKPRPIEQYSWYHMALKLSHLISKLNS